MYLAHISEDKLREQSIIEHAEGVAELSGMFAACFGCKEWGYGCGLMHDIGKYSVEFQQRLHGGPKVDHATAGAKELKLKGMSCRHIVWQDIIQVCLTVVRLRNRIHFTEE